MIPNVSKFGFRPGVAGKSLLSRWNSFMQWTTNDLCMNAIAGGGALPLHRIAPAFVAGPGKQRLHIDILFSRHSYALEHHLAGRERLGGVEAHLGADPIAGRRIELRALA